MVSVTQNDVEAESNDFDFKTTVESAYELDGYKYLKGVASSTRKDFYETIFDESCQEYFRKTCESKYIPVDICHQDRKFYLEIGKVIEASVEKKDDGITYFSIVVKLKKNSIADDIYNEIINPDPTFRKYFFGFSIKGSTPKPKVKTIDGKKVKVYSKVNLTSITITEYPANFDTFIEDANEYQEIVQRSFDAVFNNTNNLEGESLKMENEIEVEVSVETNPVSEEVSVPNAEVLNQVILVEQAKEIIEENKDAEIISKITEKVSEMSSEIMKLEASNLSKKNILMLLRRLLQEYYDVFVYNVSRDKNNLNEELDSSNVISKIDNLIEEIENEESKSKSVTESSNTSGVSENAEDRSSDRQQSFNQITEDNQVEAVEVMEEVKEDKLEVVQRSIDEKFETITSSIIEKMTQKFEEIQRSSEKNVQELLNKIESQDNEIKRLSAQPATTPLVNVTSAIKQLEDPTAVVRDRLSSKNISVRANAINEVMQGFLRHVNKK